MALTSDERIAAIVRLGDYLTSESKDLDDLFESAYQRNRWFVPSHSRAALESICQSYFGESKLKPWLSNYNINRDKAHTVGLVLAGNIPMVGIHDVLCCFLSGHRTMMKYSEKDAVLIPGIIDKLVKIEPRAEEYFVEVEKLTGFDAVIATGGDTAATHFSYYFGKYPHIIRKNRNSVAVLSGNETPSELTGLGHDVFDFFGLGCRSVSKIYIPGGFSTDVLFQAFFDFSHVIDHDKYKNNYDYSNALYMLSQKEFLTNGFVILMEDEALASRISCVHYERYNDVDQLIKVLDSHSETIQCVSTNMDLGIKEQVALGSCQRPALDQYADGIDTMKFLTAL